MESRGGITNCIEKSKNKQNQLVINQYTITKTLGEGGYATVKLARTAEKLFVIPNQAVKIFKKAVLRRKREFFNSPDGGMVIKTALDDVYRELETIRSLNHPHILKVYEILDNEEANKIYLSIF